MTTAKPECTCDSGHVFDPDCKKHGLKAEEELKAVAFAREAHGDQKYGGEPYTSHLSAVRLVLTDFNTHGDLGVAAWLHDVLEDTPVTNTELQDAFGPGVFKLVFAVSGFDTLPGPPGSNRKRRNADVYEKLRKWPEAIPLKLADRIANVEACGKTKNAKPTMLAMYQSEQQGFEAALYNAAGNYGRKMWSRLHMALNVTC